MANPNLPLQPTPFVGRTDELADITALLADPACRLLTLVGPGGIGKTRLAIQAASEAQDLFPDGVWFAALQPVSSTALLVSALVDALSLPIYGQEDPRTRLLHWLRPKALLLVADNFEHLLDDAILLSEIVETAPAVKLLVTSRETLNVREEWVRTVRPMSVPADDHTLDLARYDATRLFVERARQMRGDFVPERDRHHVIRICQLVEGLPLAIELAAARLRALSCERIAAELQHSTNILTTPLRNVPERHRDMYVVFEPCWSRLTQAQRDVFMRLSVFRGGFARDAAEGVADASLPMLTALVDKSLLRVTPTGRYEIHELVRQYSAARLEEIDGAADHIRDRHCDYYAAFLAQREQDLKGAQLLRALDEVLPEIDNIRGMWRWAVERGKWDAVAECLDSLVFVLQNRSAFHEAVDALGIAINTLGEEPSPLLGRLLLWQGYLGTLPVERSKVLLRKGAMVLREFGLYHADPMSFNYLAQSFSDLGDGEQLLQETLAYFKTRRDAWGTANTLNALLYFPWLRADFEQIEKQARESLALYRQIGNLWGISSSLHAVTEATYRQEKYDEAWRSAEENLTICEAIDDEAGIALALLRLGKVSYARGDYEEARALFERSLSVWRKIGSTFLPGLEDLAAIACIQGNYHQARLLLRDALRMERHLFTWEGEIWEGNASLAQILKVFARLLIATGQPIRAVEMLTAALPPLISWKLQRTEAEVLLANLRTTLPPDEFAVASARGEADDLEMLAAAILEELEAQEESLSSVGDSLRRPDQPFIDPLSTRELEVLQLVAEGWSNREIAQELVVTVGTVKKHLNNIFSKLHVRSRTQAIVRARELDLLS
jgi:predicted ATPase/DNA-binding CsgD family transcriptional regulator